MQNMLLLYSTTDGHTIKIIERMAARLKQQAFDVQMMPVAQATQAQIARADKIVVGASVRYGKHKKEVNQFIDTYIASLNSKPSAFFSVNVVARKADKNTPETNPYLQKFLSKIEWQPALLGVFGGMLAYPEYGLVDKTMIRLIMKMTDGPTDPDTVIDYTDWEKVDKFADKVAALSL